MLKYLQENPNYKQVSDFDCFNVIDCNNSHFRLHLKEAMYVNWKNPILNK